MDGEKEHGPTGNQTIGSPLANKQKKYPNCAEVREQTGKVPPPRRDIEQDVVESQPNQKQRTIEAASGARVHAFSDMGGEILRDAGPGLDGGILKDLWNVIEHKSVLQRRIVADHRKRESQSEQPMPARESICR